MWYYYTDLWFLFYFSACISNFCLKLFPTNSTRSYTYIDIDSFKFYYWEHRHNFFHTLLRFSRNLNKHWNCFHLLKSIFRLLYCMLYALRARSQVHWTVIFNKTNKIILIYKFYINMHISTLNEFFKSSTLQPILILSDSCQKSRRK